MTQISLKDGLETELAHAFLNLICVIGGNLWICLLWICLLDDTDSTSV